MKTIRIWEKPFFNKYGVRLGTIYLHEGSCLDSPIDEALQYVVECSTWERTKTRRIADMKETEGLLYQDVELELVTWHYRDSPPEHAFQDYVPRGWALNDLVYDELEEDDFVELRRE